MRKFCCVAAVLWFSLIVLEVRPPLHSQTLQFKRGQAVYVFAARDSHLLTMNPTLEEVKFPTGRTWKSDGSAHGHKELPLSSQYQSFALDEGLLAGFKSNYVRLPMPAADVEKALSATQLIPRPSFLDRITPDAKIRERIEKEFRKQGQYVIADSPAEADLVFLVEATYIPARHEIFSGGGQFFQYGDYRAEYLQTVLGIVVPAAAFNLRTVKSADLIDARFWEGSSIMRVSQLSRSIAPASPESVAAQFHDRKKRDPDQFPLCAASLQLLTIQGNTRANRAAPILNTNAIAPDASPPPGHKPADDRQAISVNVTMVMVPVIATDRDGNFISDLSPVNFRVFEGDVEQKIDHVIPEAEPIDVALIVDASFSVSYNFDDMVWRLAETKNAASGFTGALRPEDRLMAVSFYDRIFVHSEFTADRFQLSRALSLIQKGEGTRLYDALALVLEDRLEAIQGRKAIVLVTDGADTRSRIAGASDTLAAFDKSNAVVYAIQYVSRKDANAQPTARGSYAIVPPEDAQNNTELYQRADKFLFSLCNNSGGLLYVAQTGSNLNEIYAGIAEQLRHQYTICFNRSNAKQDWAVHNIRVEVDHPGAKVRARTGYRSFLLPPKKNAGGH